MLRYLLILLGMLGLSTAGAEPLRWIIDSDANGQATLVGEMAVSVETEQEIYPNLSRALAGTAEGRAYHEYIKALVELKSADIAPMFTAADGSRARWVAELAEAPDRHDGWKDVEKVTAKMVFNWGPYKIFPIGIRMQGDPKEYLWREALFCTSGCAMSNAFNILDASRDKFTLMMGSGTTALLTDDWQELAEKARASGLMNLENAIFFRPEWIAGALSRQYPLIAYPKVRLLSGQYYPFFNEAAQSDRGGSVQAGLDSLESFLIDIRGVDLTVADDGSYNSGDLEAVLATHWMGFEPNHMFRFFEQADAEEPMELVYYAQHPFSNQLSQWDGLHPVAVYESATGVFIFAYPVIRETVVLHMQVISFEHAAPDSDTLALSVAVQRSDAARALISGEMVEFVDHRTEALLPTNEE